ncbi:hypothetical protein [Inhella sp.]|uniref:hypothetical protein n=1 Tax=Inhella sp. TaxID=1921806 RepID=UPI0035B1CAF4
MDSIQPETKRRRFVGLREAVHAYVDGKPLKEVCVIAGVSARRFYKLLDGCQEIDTDGRLRGYRALVGGAATKKRTRTAERSPLSKPGAGYSGYFHKLLRDHEPIERGLKDILLRRGSSAMQPTVTELRSLHNKFLDLCRHEEIPTSEYPFCVEDLARRALSNWVKTTFTDAHALARILNESGADAAQAASYAQGDGTAFRPCPPYMEWQLDEYTIDLEGKYAVLTEDGSWIEVSAKRFQVLVLITREPVLVLGFKLVIGEQVQATEVLELFWNGLTGHNHVLPTIAGLNYMDGAGFPAALIEALRGLGPQFVSIDNALAHLAEATQEFVLKRFGARCRLGSPATPQERAHVEREIQALALRLIQQLPATTGSEPRSPKRGKGLRVLVPVEDLEHAIDVYFANRNGLQAASANYTSPLEQIQRMMARGKVPLTGSRVSLSDRHLFHASSPVSIKGSVKTGKAPHVNFMGSKYTSTTLRASWSRIGQFFDLYCDPNDLRTVWLYERGTGKLFDTLKVIGRWATFKHDMRIRRMWLRLKRKAERDDRPQDDPLHFLFQKLRSKAKKDRSAASQFAHFMHFLSSNAQRGGDDRLSTAFRIWSKLVEADDLAAFIPISRETPKAAEGPSSGHQPEDALIAPPPLMLSLPSLERRRIH